MHQELIAENADGAWDIMGGITIGKDCNGLLSEVKGDKFPMKSRDRFFKFILIPLVDRVDNITIKHVKKQEKLQYFFHESGESQSFLNPFRSGLAKS